MLLWATYTSHTCTPQIFNNNNNNKKEKKSKEKLHGKVTKLWDCKFVIWINVVMNDHLFV